MSTVTRRKRASRSNIGPYRRFELLSGEFRYRLPTTRVMATASAGS